MKYKVSLSSFVYLMQFMIITVYAFYHCISFSKFQASNVYVKNIDDDVTDEELREHFSQCGAITSARLMRDDKGISKGFGFVCFSAPEEASKAVSIFHGKFFKSK